MFYKKDHDFVHKKNCVCLNERLFVGQQCVYKHMCACFIRNIQERSLLESPQGRERNDVTRTPNQSIDQ